MPDEKNLLPWGPEKKLKWFLNQRVKRSYRDDVLVRLEALGKKGGNFFAIEKYGALTLDPEKYPLYIVRVGQKSDLPYVLITGGVHGYETSGVKGALLFLEKHVLDYISHFNFVVAPCISPWSYETINRLDPVMENPNRDFKSDGKAEECRFLMSYLETLGVEFSAHLDLHETTDSDKQFIPEEYSKNGKFIESKDVDIPDGFYLIGTKDGIRPDLEKAMIDSVRKVTHIAPTDKKGTISGDPSSQEGVVHTSIPGLCAEYSSAKSKLGAYTTEMYPDGEKFRTMPTEKAEAVCNETQVACIRGALDFWRK